MIAAIHQPHFLPWLGYVNKAVNSDVFIWLDSVQFRKNYFQNRTHIVGRDGQRRWLTLPVHAAHDARISDVTIADVRWKTRIAKTLRQEYGCAPYFATCWPVLEAAIGDASDSLSDVNLRLFLAVLQLLGLETVRVVQASALDVDVADPTDRLVALCCRVGATTYVAGRGGRAYLRPEAFDAAGITVLWQAFDVERTAYQRPDGSLVSGASVVDPLFQVGPARTRELTMLGWTLPR